MAQKKILEHLEPQERLKQLINYSNSVEVDPHVPPMRYYRSGIEMVRMANVYYEEGSLENSYVLYLKFMTLFLEKIRKHPDFNTVPIDVKARNQAKMREILPKAEKLKQQLLDQYKDDYNRCLAEVKFPGNSTLRCYTCNREGHKIADCDRTNDFWKSFNRTKRAKGSCLHREMMSHRYKNCPPQWSRAEVSGATPDSTTNKVTLIEKRTVRCYNCNREGHKFADCDRIDDFWKLWDRTKGVKGSCLYREMMSHRYKNCPQQLSRAEVSGATPASTTNTVTLIEKKRVRFYNCNREGHKIADCDRTNDFWKSLDRTKTAKGSCLHREMMNHRYKNCPQQLSRVEVSGSTPESTTNTVTLIEKRAVRCYNCNREGHKMADCDRTKAFWKSFDRTKRAKESCLHCEMMSHKYKNCPQQLSRAEVSGATPASTTNTATLIEKKRVRFYNCNREGHKIADCDRTNHFWKSLDRTKTAKGSCLHHEMMSHRYKNCPQQLSRVEVSGSTPESTTNTVTLIEKRAVRCYNCNREGHKMADCDRTKAFWKSFDRTKRAKESCLHCEMMSHKYKNCPQQLSRAEVSGATPASTTNTATLIEKKRVRFYNCNREGHKIADCDRTNDFWKSLDRTKTAKRSCLHHEMMSHRYKNCPQQWSQAEVSGATPDSTTNKKLQQKHDLGPKKRDTMRSIKPKITTNFSGNIDVKIPGSLANVNYPDSYSNVPHVLPPSAPPPSSTVAVSNNRITDTPSVDRTKKPSEQSINDRYDTTVLRGVVVPMKVMTLFQAMALSNTIKNVETCGVLTGKLEHNKLIITHMILPKQKGTSDSCMTMNEEEIFDYQDQHNLITLGWIHVSGDLLFV
ncbi:hypothetical protein NQ314_005415 [Rhamnusium bicolor]|uniref:Uncharacterized protein n=1 Tax=Rhamnusium bicolor TaxID=1586634 RepID=A0AAV8ZI54_9CUCU|nr:hypothetical protein NQ314_005415 [Rhamnusium bicolor]